MKTSLHACPAPAKLNLFLHVVGRRADGYHLLQSVFQLIDRGDTLHFDLRDDGLIRRVNDVPGVDIGTDEEYESLRVGAGWPAMGVDFAVGCVPAETGVVAVSVSFTKGCYPGQELVERMDSRAVTAPHVLRLVDDVGYSVGQMISDGVVVTSVGGGKAIVRAKRESADVGRALSPA